MKKIYLAGGCFWGVSHYYSLMNGISKATVGYANSDVINPDYQMVCAKKSSASECVEVIYDEKIICLAEILKRYLEIIDPYSLNKQGGDIGPQYRTGIYYVDEADLSTIDEFMDDLKSKSSQKVQIEVLELINFYKAEEYHQDYLYKNPNGYCHVSLAAMNKYKGK